MNMPDYNFLFNIKLSKKLINVYVNNIILKKMKNEWEMRRRVNEKWGEEKISGDNIF